MWGDGLLTMCQGVGRRACWSLCGSFIFTDEAAGRLQKAKSHIWWWKTYYGGGGRLADLILTLCQRRKEKTIGRPLIMNIDRLRKKVNPVYTALHECCDPPPKNRNPGYVMNGVVPQEQNFFFLFILISSFIHSSFLFHNSSFLLLVSI
jgi:hypothetical protein